MDNLIKTMVLCFLLVTFFTACNNSGMDDLSCGDPYIYEYSDSAVISASSNNQISTVILVDSSNLFYHLDSAVSIQEVPNRDITIACEIKEVNGITDFKGVKLNSSIKGDTATVYFTKNTTFRAVPPGFSLKSYVITVPDTSKVKVVNLLEDTAR